MIEINLTGKKTDILTFAASIRENQDLTPADRLILFTLLSRINEEKTEASLVPVLAKDTALSPAKIKKSLQRLKTKKWIKVHNNQYLLQTPSGGKKSEGNKIARSWPEIFGTRQLTPHLFTKFETYLEDGMEEELIIEVMKISARNAEGNPINYCFAILSDLLERDILTAAELTREQEERGENLDGSVSNGITKNKETARKAAKKEKFTKNYR